MSYPNSKSTRKRLPAVTLRTKIRLKYKLPVVIVIVNNNGIYSGFDKTVWNELQSSEELTRVNPPSALSAEVHYEKLVEMFGKKGYFCRTIPELQEALRDAFKVKDGPSVVNCMINPSADRKPQSFNWLTESKL